MITHACFGLKKNSKSKVVPKRNSQVEVAQQCPGCSQGNVAMQVWCAYEVVCTPVVANSGHSF